MSELQGYSYLQYDQLEELKARLNATKNTVDKKVDENIFTYDVNKPVRGLDGMDTAHRNQIAELKNKKADVVAYNSRTTELTQNDTKHEEQMNALESNYATKVSQFEFEKMVAELKANDDSQDARLDALEQQFSEIQVRIVDDVKEKASELVKKTDFNAMISTLQHGDTGLHNKIIQLASKDSINTALANYNASIANLQDRASYNTEINKIVQRNHDFERRLMGIDQFFRVLSETYKLYKEDNTEIKYTAEFQEGIPLPPAWQITGFMRYVAGSRGSGSRNIQLQDDLIISFTPFGYNTLTGEIKLYDSSNNLIGTISQDSINTTTLAVAVPISSPISSLTSLGAIQTDSSGAVIKTETITQQTIQSVPNVTPIRIIESSLSINGFTSQNVSVSTFVEGVGVVSFTPALPNGLNHTFTNGTLTISGSVSSPISPSQVYTMKISNGSTEDEIPVNIEILPAVPGAPTGLSATPGDSQVSIVFTPGSAGGSPITNYKYSIDGGSYIVLSPANATSPVVITGLTNGTTYQIRLRAVNSGGDGAESVAVSATPATVPSAPTNISGSRGDGTATISFTAGNNGGSPITNYKYSIDNGVSYTAFSPTVTVSPLTITGLTNGVTYQIRIRAVNAVGDGIQSSAVSVTPAVPPASLSTSWFRWFSGTAVFIPVDTKTDSLGNVYICGKHSNQNVAGITYGADSVSGTTGDGFLAKFNSSGNFLWAKRIGTSKQKDYISAIGIDNSDNVYIIGGDHDYSNSPPSDITFQNTYNSANGWYNTYIIKYNSAGTIQWARFIDGAVQEVAFSSNFPYNIVFDSDNNLYFATIHANNTNYNGGPSLNTGTGILLTKMGPNGGNAIWNRWIVNSGTYSNTDYHANALLIDANNNIYLAGAVRNANINTTNFLFTTTGTSTNGFITKYDTSGNVLWGRTFSGVDNELRCHSLAVDGSNNVYLSIRSIFFNPTIGITPSNSSESVNRSILIKINPNGTLNTARFMNPTSDVNSIYKMFIYNNSLYVVESNTTEVAALTGTSGVKGIVVYRTDTLVPIRYRPLAGTSNPNIYSMALDRDGGVYAVGTSGNTNASTGFNVLGGIGGSGVGFLLKLFA